jgi:hypothetical protein
VPYIERNMRAVINNRLADVLAIVRDLSAGEVNYLITQIIRAWTTRATYGRFNEAVGILECAKLELYRRAVAPYEDKKIAENGDVY